MLIVTMEAIRSKMRPATFRSRHGAQRNGFGAIQHKVEFQRTNEACIEHLSFIMNGHAIPPLTKTADRLLCMSHPFLIAKYAEASVMAHPISCRMRATVSRSQAGPRPF